MYSTQNVSLFASSIAHFFDLIASINCPNKRTVMSRYFSDSSLKADNNCSVESFSCRPTRKTFHESCCFEAARWNHEMVPHEKLQLQKIAIWTVHFVMPHVQKSSHPDLRLFLHRVKLEFSCCCVADWLVKALSPSSVVLSPLTHKTVAKRSSV